MPPPVLTLPDTQAPPSEVIDFFERAEALVNLTENLSDLALDQYRDILNNASRRASMRMESLVKSLPHATGPDKALLDQIDTDTPAGKRKRKLFLKAMAAIYRDWRKEISSAAGVSRWGEKRPLWDRALGTAPRKRAPSFIVRYRTALEQLSQLLRGVPALLENGFTEAAPGTARFETRAARKKYGISFRPRARSFEIETDDRELVVAARDEGRDSGVNTRDSVESVTDAWLENILKGIDETARKHANDVMETATGVVSRGQLNGLASRFTADADNRQQALSIQTHVRAAVRRHVTAKAPAEQMMLHLPATRPQDIVSKPNVQARAYKIESVREILEKGGGSADGLGGFPGDQMQLVRVPQSALRTVEAEALRRRERYLTALKVTASKESLSINLAHTYRRQIIDLGRSVRFDAAILKGGTAAQRLAWLSAQQVEGGLLADSRGRLIWTGKGLTIPEVGTTIMKVPAKPTLPKRQTPLPKTVTNPETSAWKQWQTSLTNNEEVALTRWQLADYDAIRLCQQNPKRCTKEIKELTGDLESALVRAPKYDGTVYRGFALRKKEYETLIKKGIYETRALGSSSLNEDVARQFANAYRNKTRPIRVILKIRTKESGTWLGLKTTQQEEVLLAKGSKFKIKNIEKGKVFIKIDLDEI